MPSLTTSDTLTVALVGAGRLATNLGLALAKTPMWVVQVYSRTPESAAILASKIGTQGVSRVEEITCEADLYIVALTDNALMELAPRLTQGRTSGLWVHTAGSVGMEVWADCPRCGVMYPMQTFSKERHVRFAHLPIFVEANSEADTRLLESIARSLSDNVSRATTEQRRCLHLAAVLVCNFTNHLYDLADRLLQANGLSFSTMLPLIDETTAKVHELLPHAAQTGPAMRWDTRIIERHLQMLADEPEVQELYRQLSEGIHRLQGTADGKQ